MTEQTHVVALSGGKDSTAMALALAEYEPRDYMFVCTPTGDEFPEVAEHLARMEQLLGQPIQRLTDRSLDSETAKQNMIPNFRARWCTRRIKIEPFIALLKSIKPAVSYVGLRADELGREGNSYGGEVNVLTDGTSVPDVEHRFPLTEWGWALDEVWAYLDKRGITIPKRTDCRRCFYQTVREWFEFWARDPEGFREAAAQEMRFGHTWRNRQVGSYRRVDDLLFGSFEYEVSARDSWPAWLMDMEQLFAAGYEPKVRQRESNCRVCTL